MPRRSRISVALIGARESAGLSQSALSRICGVPQTTISRYERGVHAPTLKDALALAQALGSTADGLFPHLRPKAPKPARKRPESANAITLDNAEASA